MSLLILSLPPGPPGSYAWATSHDGQSLAAHGDAAASLLPAAGRGVEVVAVVPARQLSWRRATLPRGIGPGSPRLRAVLAGLLEEDLLDDPEHLHFALAPDASADAVTWVAACPRQWLYAHLQALEAAGRPVNRIVPELPPRSGTLQLTAVGEPEHPLLLASGGQPPGHALTLPLHPSALPLLPGGPDALNTAAVQAEPAVAELAERLLGTQLHIEAPARRLLAASRTDWDLAQLELTRTGAARAARRMGAIWRDLAHAPLWRPVRWGLALLLLAQLTGLNLWAWRTQADLRERRQQLAATLTQTFPHVRLVIDAPVQMGREVAALRQATGAPTAHDLDAMLAALTQALPGQPAPATLHYSPGQLRLGGLQLADTPLAEANQRLRPLGYQLNAQSDALTLQHEGAP